MSKEHRPIAIAAAAVTPRPNTTMQPFAAKAVGREKRVLGNLFGLTNFGVNLERLRPGAF